MPALKVQLSLAHNRATQLLTFATEASPKGKPTPHIQGPSWRPDGAASGEQCCKRPAKRATLLFNLVGCYLYRSERAFAGRRPG